MSGPIFSHNITREMELLIKDIQNEDWLIGKALPFLLFRVPFLLLVVIQ